MSWVELGFNGTLEAFSSTYNYFSCFKCVCAWAIIDFFSYFTIIRSAYKHQPVFVSVCECQCVGWWLCTQIVVWAQYEKDKCRKYNNFPFYFLNYCDSNNSSIENLLLLLKNAQNVMATVIETMNYFNSQVSRTREGDSSEKLVQFESFDSTFSE